MWNVALLTILVVSACARLNAVDRKTDESGIRRLLQTYETAINRGDVEAAMENYLPDADVWVVGYDRVAGREAIRRNEQRAIETPDFQSWTISVDAIRFVSADTAIVESSGALAIGRNRIAERITWVVSRTAGDWRIAGVRIMVFEPVDQ
jgi:uncharacterized protein (TIGR02246 family)